MKRIISLFALLLALPVWAQSITVASTTSTQNSGLYDFLLPQFTAQTGIDVRVVAVGTGQAIKIAENGDADVLIVHHRPSEDRFVEEGFGIERRDVMYNDFVLIGPRSDPAQVKPASNLKEALLRIQNGETVFISRGDDSGTHKKELELWSLIGSTPQENYREIGAGMGAVLNMASAINAYTLSDRGTWLSFGNKGELELLYSHDPALHNPYGVILVNPERHPHVKIDAARVFSDWLVSPKGQNAIGTFRVDNKQLFCPNPIDTDDQLPDLCPSSQ